MTGSSFLRSDGMAALVVVSAAVLPLSFRMVMTALRKPPGKGRLAGSHA